MADCFTITWVLPADSPVQSLSGELPTAIQHQEMTWESLDIILIVKSIREYSDTDHHTCALITSGGAFISLTYSASGELHRTFAHSHGDETKYAKTGVYQGVPLAPAGIGRKRSVFQRANQLNLLAGLYPFSSSVKQSVA